MGKSRKSVPGILDISIKSNRDGYLVTVNIKKVFDFLDHGSLLIDFAGQFGFGNNFIDWTKVLLTNQEPNIINDDITTSHFKLEKGARQSDPISAYLFIITFKIICAMIKINSNMKVLNNFSHHYLYALYVDDTTFF